MKKFAMSLALSVITTAVFAAPPKVTIAAVVPPDTSASDRGRAEAIVRLLARTISSEVTVAAQNPMAVSPRCAAQRGGAGFHECVYLESAIHANRRSVGAGLPARSDALVVAIFDPSEQTGLFGGIYYLLTRNGDWRSGSFLISEVPDGRILVRAHIPEQAVYLGLDVPSPTPVTVAASKGVTWYGDGLFETPAELK